MAVYRYPPEVHEFVREWSPKLRDRELARACNEALGTNFTEAGMRSFRGNHGYLNRKKQWSSEEYWRYQTRYPQGMYEFIRDNSWGVSSEEMAQMVNERFGTNWNKGTMKTFRQRHGIKSGVTGWFQKGRSPGNKGKKLEEYIADPERVEDIKRRISATQFKKCQEPPNTLPVGTELMLSDGYIWVKIDNKPKVKKNVNWKQKHRLLWEAANGPIPEGHRVIFLNNDRTDVRIENLACVSKAEHIRLNQLGIKSDDPEVRKTAINIARVKTLAGKRRE